jgi:hypothetical protein
MQQGGEFRPELLVTLCFDHRKPIASTRTAATKQAQEDALNETPPGASHTENNTLGCSAIYSAAKNRATECLFYLNSITSLYTARHAVYYYEVPCLTP